MKNKHFIFIAVFIIIAGITSQICAKDLWKVKSHLTISEPGIVEAVLPPELHSIATGDNIDFDLTGPDGKSRSFELYWRERVGRSSIKLVPLKFEFREQKEFVWEGKPDERKTDQKIVADHIRIEIGNSNFIGRVDIEAFGPDGWTYLKKNEALFNLHGQVRAELEIEKGVYQKIRLRFSGFDKKYKEKFAPISRVILSGKKPGKDYVERLIRPDFQQSETDGKIEIRAILPGSRLSLQSLSFITQTQFQGSWQVGTEIIAQGKQAFKKIKEGSITHVSGKKQVVAIDIGTIWKGKNFILKLDSKEKYIGHVTDFKIKVRSLRMVFSADTTGLYTAITGTGKKAKILQYPGDKDRNIDHMLSFSTPERNKNWHSASLVEKYEIQGGPFNDKGFTWKSAIPIANIGYYRLALNMDASHDKNRTGIRLVKDNTQIPFFFGRNEKKETDFTGSSSFKYDSDKNQTIVIIKFPYASSFWSELVLYANGIFKREILFEIPKPGRMGWQKWITRSWKNDNNKESKLKIDLQRYSEEQEQIKITINHGDNQPVKISKITAFYSSPAIHFLAYETGAYSLYGGNPDASPPNYDLSIIQSFLLEELTEEVRMNKIERLSSDNWNRQFNRIFKDRGWGLYAVLGLVTVVLLFLIVTLFPKVTKPE
jgi:hypothetical protein